MTKSVVVFTPGGGHAERLMPLVALIAERGIDVHVFSRPETSAHVAAAGGTFHDLFAAFPMDAVDRESVPLPSRFVTFAAAYAVPLAEVVGALRPSCIVYDSFMVVAPLIARQLGVPFVGMRAGHAQLPDAAIAAIAQDSRVRTSDACLEAVAKLRDDFGVKDAGPFLYLANVSPFLNIYPEPEAFVRPEVGSAFSPVAFFGSLAPEMRDARPLGESWNTKKQATRIYLSFGTAIWRYYAEAAVAALATVARAAAGRGADVLVGLGGYDVSSADLARIQTSGVRVARFVDQWRALGDADMFVTHHGLNSTHEAIFHRVPMLSYPFFGDQPAMAANCARLGLARPLTIEPRAPLDVTRAGEQIDALFRDRREVQARLHEARQWELNTINARPAIVDRLLAL